MVYGKSRRSFDEIAMEPEMERNDDGFLLKIPSKN
jgi:hypothetical protein